MHPFKHRHLFCLLLVLSQCSFAQHANDSDAELEQNAIALAKQILRTAIDSIPDHEITMVRLNDVPTKADDTEQKPSTKVLRSRIGTDGRVLRFADKNDPLSAQFGLGFRGTGVIRSSQVYSMIGPATECTALLQDGEYDNAIVGRVLAPRQLASRSLFETIQYTDVGHHPSNPKGDSGDSTSRAGWAGYYVWRLRFDKVKQRLHSLALGHTIVLSSNPGDWTNAFIRDFSDFDTVDGVTYPKRITLRQVRLGREQSVERYLITSFKPVALLNGDPQFIDDRPPEKRTPSKPTASTAKQSSKGSGSDNAKGTQVSDTLNVWIAAAVSSLVTAVSMLAIWLIVQRRNSSRMPIVPELPDQNPVL